LVAAIISSFAGAFAATYFEHVVKQRTMLTTRLVVDGAEMHAHDSETEDDESDPLKSDDACSSSAAASSLFNGSLSSSSVSESCACISAPSTTIDDVLEVGRGESAGEAGNDRGNQARRVIARRPIVSRHSAPCSSSAAASSLFNGSLSSSSVSESCACISVRMRAAT
jgi:hypothetical protein